jgi:hypothetical protein
LSVFLSFGFVRRLLDDRRAFRRDVTECHKQGGRERNAGTRFDAAHSALGVKPKGEAAADADDDDQRDVEKCFAHRPKPPARPVCKMVSCGTLFESTAGKPNYIS